MHYQIAWKTEPGLRGLSCSDFRAVETTSPDNERGVAIALGSQAEAEAFIAELERVFGPQRFSNNATAFETVKAYILDWAARKNSGRV